MIEADIILYSLVMILKSRYLEVIEINYRIRRFWVNGKRVVVATNYFPGSISIFYGEVFYSNIDYIDLNNVIYDMT